MAQKTFDELQRLKSNWRSDPCWDIETTEGFEAHYDDLLQYRLEVEAEWDALRDFHWQEVANQLGIPGNVALAQYIKGLERRIDELEKWRAEERS